MFSTIQEPELLASAKGELTKSGPFSGGYSTHQNRLLGNSTRAGESQVGKSEVSKPGTREGGALATTLDGPTSLVSEAANPVALSDQAEVLSND